MTKQILILNGPNLNLLGEREPQIYGHTTLAQVEERCRAVGARLGFEIVFRQSNTEGQLIDWIHEHRKTAAGIVINPAAYSFTSMAILDALKAAALPVVEVHISNVDARESFRHTSVTAAVCRGKISGLGFLGYRLSMEYLTETA